MYVLAKHLVVFAFLGQSCRRDSFSRLDTCPLPRLGCIWVNITAAQSGLVFQHMCLDLKLRAAEVTEGFFFFLFVHCHSLSFCLKA